MTPAQLTALRQAIDANPTWAAIPNNSDGNYALAALLNAPAVPAFNVWRTEAPVNAILDAINWGTYTPSDAIASADPTLTQQVGRLLAIQTKQMNLQLMVQGRDVLNCSRPNVRGGLRDAVIQVPSGAGGAATSPGGANGATVLAQCVRPATRAEVMLAAQSQASDTTGTTTARVLTFEGDVQDVEAATLIYHDDGTIWGP